MHVFPSSYTLKKAKIILQVYTDSDCVGSVIDRNIASRCFFNLGSTMILWINTKKTNVELSMNEEKYIVACSSSSESVWLWKFLEGLFDLPLEMNCIFCDNQSCIKSSKNLGFHDKSMNIDIKYHYIQYMV